MSATMTSKQRVLAMLRGEPVDRLPNMPITMMFAADQIGAKYGKYALDHRVMVEAQIRMAYEFDIDHVSTISCPAREAADIGATVKYYEDQPPAIDEHNALLLDKTRLATLKAPDPLGGGRMHDRIRGIALLKEKVGDDKAIEGWVEGPCAEGSDLRGINNLMMDFMDDPEFVGDLFAFIVEMETAFAREQARAGATYIGIGDAAASLVGPKIYEEFVWPHEKRLLDNIHALGLPVRLHICGNTSRITSGMGRLGADFIDLDYMSPVDRARAAMGPKQVVTGNIDPVRVLRDGTPDSVYAAIAECHRQAGDAYIVCAGCEVPRDTHPDNVRALACYARDANLGRAV